ncbi:hypothetical protein SAPIO_CDS4276 [Scedosporium apiospermum]|uniref:Uncharacterized protein n=1 Tax=Pseudallescheria apiosperma TaxID=563466 RepID=A0A084G8K4_PSEDA|nr:uncharacterized protein SAPIO_CDS4276 [Scedosporium apiospermum]KEZ43666.1 hypothetical protein SAPIO_CDS4276 [Scedosporium apiospermum]
MKPYASLGAMSALVQLSHANLDIVTLLTPSGNFIQEAAATLVVGDIPNPVTGDVALWSAIMMDRQDFLQGVTQNSPPGLGYCQDLGQNWCNFAYKYGNGNPTAGTPVKAPPGSRIKTHYKLNTGTEQWEQRLYINDQLVSELTSSRGQHGSIFYISTECAAGNCAAAPAHSWEDIFITLNQPDERFLYRGSWEHEATGGEMSTPDGGKTWNFTTLFVPETRP